MNMYRSTFCFVVLLAPLLVLAQKKNFTYDQLFKGDYPSILKPMPVIQGWVDDDHYIESKRDESGKETLISVDVLSGKTAPHTPKEEVNPQIEGARNLTVSPDGKFAAYTKKDNNLYLTELATK